MTLIPLQDLATGIDPSVIDSNVIVAFIAALATVSAAWIALRKDKEASPSSISPPSHGASDSGVVTVLVSRISELEDRDNEHDKIEQQLWAYVRKLQEFAAFSPDQVPRKIPPLPAALLDRQEESA